MTKRLVSRDDLLWGADSMGCLARWFSSGEPNEGPDCGRTSQRRFLTYPDSTLSLLRCWVRSRLYDRCENHCLKEPRMNTQSYQVPPCMDTRSVAKSRFRYHKRNDGGQMKSRFRFMSDLIPKSLAVNAEKFIASKQAE